MFPRDGCSDMAGRRLISKKFLQSHPQKRGDFELFLDTWKWPAGGTTQIVAVAGESLVTIRDVDCRRNRNLRNDQEMMTL